MMRMKFVFAVFMFLIGLTPHAFAQGGNTGNGGEDEELQIKQILQKLPYFIDQDAYREKFDDIQINQLFKIAPLVQVRTMADKPKDKTGRARTAVNEWVGGIPELRIHGASVTKLLSGREQKKVLTVLLFHELLNFAGYEIVSAKNESAKDGYQLDEKALSSIYPISSRLFLIVSEFESYEPIPIDFSKYHISCRDHSTFDEMEHFGLYLTMDGKITFRTHIHQMFKDEDAFPKSYKRYNERVLNSLTDPARLIGESDVGAFVPGATTRVNAVLTVKNKHKYFKKPYILVQGQMSLVDRFSRRLYGTLVVSPLEDPRWLISSSMVNAVFSCSGSMEENGGEQ